MYIDVVPNRNSPPAVLLREAWREGQKTRKRTVANLSDWPPERIETFRRVLRDEPLVSPHDLFTTQKSLPQFGHDRDGKNGLPIIVYGVMTNGEGCPVAVSVYAGNTGDPTTVADQIEKLREQFRLQRVVLVGDRGMLTQPQIDKLKQHPGLGWITALTSTAIQELVKQGALQLSLLDEKNLAEITAPDYPGERLMV